MDSILPNPWNISIPHLTWPTPIIYSWLFLSLSLDLRSSLLDPPPTPLVSILCWSILSVLSILCWSFLVSIISKHQNYPGLSCQFSSVIRPHLCSIYPSFLGDGSVAGRVSSLSIYSESPILSLEFNYIFSIPRCLINITHTIPFKKGQGHPSKPAPALFSFILRNDHFIFQLFRLGS